MTAVVLRGDAAHLPLPDASVDLIVTSPPYFALRSYTDTCRICLDVKSNGLDPAEVIVGYEEHVRTRHHYEGQIGSEATPAEFVAALLDCTREWVRVLKPSGSLFVNLGDKYASGGGGWSGGHGGGRLNGHVGQGVLKSGYRRRATPDIPTKSLLGLPWRYALGCIDQLGLILRAEIVWAKPNGLPESVTDRVRRSHEQVFHFTRLPRYFAAVDEIREAHSQLTHGRGTAKPRDVRTRDGDGAFAFVDSNPLGKLPGSVWTIPSAPLTVPPHLGIDHFAAFPPALVRPIVLGWSPAGICTRCGEGRRPVVHRVTTGHDNRKQSRGDGARDSQQNLGPRSSKEYWAFKLAGGGDQITGYACACPHPDAPTRPAVVLDPFGGTGTTALVASVYGRHAITVDMSADYCRLAAWRTRDPAERARAMDVPKPPPVPDGMEPLFSM